MKQINVDGIFRELVNLTSHPIEIDNDETGRITIDPENPFERCYVECSTIRVDSLLARRAYGRVVGLPEREPGSKRLYIVSSIVKAQPGIQHRTDVVTVGGIERGSHGEPLRARYLVI